MKIFLIPLVIFFISYPLSGNGQKSNSRIVEDLLSQTLNSKLKLNLEGKKKIYLTIEKNEFAPILEKELIFFLSTNSIEILRNEDESELNLFASLKDVMVQYPKIISYPLFGDQEILRIIQVKGELILRDSNKVLLAEKFSELNTDTVNSKTIASIESNSIKSLRTDLPEIPIWRSLLEPASVAVVSTAIIYLFFSIRSK